MLSPVGKIHEAEVNKTEKDDFGIFFFFPSLVVVTIISFFLY